jgi:hypothetical protein
MKNKCIKSRRRNRRTRYRSIRNIKSIKAHRKSIKNRKSIKKRNSTKNRRTRNKKKYTRRIRKMRGGADFSTAQGSGGDPAADMADKNSSQNAGNQSLQGGGGTGVGDGEIGCGVSCCDNNNDYGYPCPDGMCGPIPQVPNAVSQGLIEKAAVIATTAEANAEFDGRT